MSLVEAHLKAAIIGTNTIRCWCETIQLGRLDLLHDSVQNGADVNFPLGYDLPSIVTYDDLDTPIAIAAESGEFGDSPTSTPNLGQMLTDLFSWEDYSRTRKLGEYDERKFRISNHNLPLCHAARRGDSEMARLLVEWGADVNASSGQMYDGTALQAAAKGDNLAMVKFLLDQGADPNDSPALIVSVESCSTEMVKLFLDNNADDIIAKQNGHIRTFLDLGAN